MTSMVTRSYTVKFLTPAFLGNAEQDGAWRTPPFKALLRQWWRVAVASECKYNTETLLERESALFGSASNGEGRKSLIRLRLNRWDEGKLKSWDGLEQAKVHHPETERTQHLVGPHAYLGYGPLDGRGNTKLNKPKAAINANESAEFSMAFPADAEHADPLHAALWLMDRYGTLGGRSRNGWGSFALASKGDTPALSASLDERLACDWKQALALDWPHAIGLSDGKALVWETSALSDWRLVMRRLAEIKIGLRTQFKFPNVAPPHPTPLDRHWLSYPITKHGTKAWDRNARLPNSLRFKVREGADSKLRGLIFHVPCLPPKEFRPDRAAIETVWQRVHTFLDAPQQQLQRIES